MAGVEGVGPMGPTPWPGRIRPGKRGGGAGPPAGGRAGIGPPGGMVPPTGGTVLARRERCLRSEARLVPAIAGTVSRLRERRPAERCRERCRREWCSLMRLPYGATVPGCTVSCLLSAARFLGGTVPADVRGRGVRAAWFRRLGTWVPRKTGGPLHGIEPSVQRNKVESAGTVGVD